MPVMSRLKNLSGTVAIAGVAVSIAVNPGGTNGVVPNCAADLGATEVGVLQVGISKVREPKYGVNHVGVLEPGAGQVGKAEINVIKFAIPKTAFGQIGEAKVGLGHVDIYTPGITQVRTA